METPFGNACSIGMYDCWCYLGGVGALNERPKSQQRRMGGLCKSKEQHEDLICISANSSPATYAPTEADANQPLREAVLWHPLPPIPAGGVQAVIELPEGAFSSLQPRREENPDREVLRYCGRTWSTGGSDRPTGWWCLVLKFMPVRWRALTRSLNSCESLTIHLRIKALRLVLLSTTPLLPSSLESAVMTFIRVQAGARCTAQMDRHWAEQIKECNRSVKLHSGTQRQSGIPSHDIPPCNYNYQ